MANSWWSEGLTDVCESFQMDLSCLVDGELDDAASGRAVAHIELCTSCREFFDDVRLQVRMHSDVTSPGELLERFEALTGSLLGREVEALELRRKLAGIFYQLGKAYVLAATDPDWRTRVFDPAVRVELEQIRGRGFVDGVMGRAARDGSLLGPLPGAPARDAANGSDAPAGEATGSRGGVGGQRPSGGAGAPGGAGGSGNRPAHRGRIDWVHARHMLNGQLERIQSPLEKGRRMLEEALEADPSHEEARIYSAWLAVQEGKTVKAAREFKRVFDGAVSESNRGHAAVQLGLLSAAEGEYRKAIVCFRWVVMSGLEAIDERFFFVRFNIGMYWAHLRRPERALAAFRELLDRHPDRAGEIACFFARSPKLRAAIDAQPGFPERLLSKCPEFFRRPASEVGTTASGGNGQVERGTGIRSPKQE